MDVETGRTVVGVARMVDPRGNRAYEPPEVFLRTHAPSRSADSWAFGCLLAQRLRGESIFLCTTVAEHLVRLCLLLGFPSDAEARAVMSAEQLESLRGSAVHAATRGGPSTPLAELLPTASISGLHLLQQCLRWDPATRILPEAAVRHPCFLRAS